MIRRKMVDDAVAGAGATAVGTLHTPAACYVDIHLHTRV